MSENKNKQELSLDELDQVAGGNIIDDTRYELVSLTKTIVMKVRQKQEEDNARANNTAALKNAAKENCIEKKETSNHGGTTISYIRQIIRTENEELSVPTHLLIQSDRQAYSYADPADRNLFAA